MKILSMYVFIKCFSKIKMSLLASGVLANPSTPYFSLNTSISESITASPIILNFADSVSPAAAMVNFPKGTPTQITSISFVANFQTGATDVMPLIMAQIPSLIIGTNGAGIDPLDTLTIFVDVSIGAGSPVVLTPAQVVAPPPGGTDPAVTVSFNPIGPAVPDIASGSNTYTIRLMGLYLSAEEGTLNAEFNFDPFDFYAQVIGCAL